MTTYIEQKIFPKKKKKKKKIKNKKYWNIKSRAELMIQLFATIQFSDQDIDEFQSTQLVNLMLSRCTDLVTYSQADLMKFPSRRGFGQYIKKCFNSGSRQVKVHHWTWPKEKHQTGRELVAFKVTIWNLQKKFLIERRNSSQFFW